MVQGILKFRGALAQAAPSELAELTAELLINAEKDSEEAGSPFRQAFGHANLDFVPVSPSQGPFLELLVHAPEQGLRLIRRLVDHAVSYMSRGREFGTNAFQIPTANGEDLVFPWAQSYGWSRDIGGGPAIVTSALMALEAWAHSRIEAGEPVEKVLVDVIGPAHAPAAYLLVVVDLLLSHWPNSSDAAVPFVACPELLCLDRERSIADTTEIPDICGIRELQREPTGLASIEGLKARASRRSTVENLLGSYSLDEADENRRRITELLRSAETRLGPPKADSTLGDAEFMVVHALNLVDPKNWREVSLRNEDRLTVAFEYVSPAAEAAHLNPLQDESRERQANGVMRARIGNALNDPKRSSPVFAAEALNWAQRMDQQPDRTAAEEDDGADRAWMREEAIVTAAVIAARDGGAELISGHLDWIRSTFVRVLNGKDDPVHRFRSGLKFNPMAIAFAGMALLLKTRFSLEYARTLLKASGNQNPAAAHGFAPTAALIASIDERLPRSVLRCALSASVHAHRECGHDGDFQNSPHKPRTVPDHEPA